MKSYNFIALFYCIGNIVFFSCLSIFNDFLYTTSLVYLGLSGQSEDMYFAVANGYCTFEVHAGGFQLTKNFRKLGKRWFVKTFNGTPVAEQLFF